MSDSYCTGGGTVETFTMSQLEYTKELGLWGIIFYPHELAHLVVARSWTSEAEITTLPPEILSGPIRFGGAQVQAPIPEGLSLNRIRLMAIAPLIIWGPVSVITASAISVPFKSLGYFSALAFFLISGGPSAEDISTLFKAMKTRENGGIGTDYADLEDFSIEWWVYAIWLFVIVIWAAFEIMIFTYIA